MMHVPEHYKLTVRAHHPATRALAALLVATTVATAWSAEPAKDDNPEVAIPEDATQDISQIDPLDNIIVVGTNLDDAAFEAETTVRVSREDLETIVPAGPEQLLGRLPGVSVFRPGGAGGVSEVFLRGGESNFTAVYVDGVRLNDPANTRGGSFDFSSLAVNAIERVDIAMGAMSAVYGSDAMAGVIRIRTAWPQAGDASIYAEAGTEQDWRTGAAASLAIGEAAALGFRADAQDGGDAVNGSSLELTSLAAQLAGRRTNGDAWQVNLRRVDRDRTSFPEVSGGPAFALLPDLETTDAEDLALSAMTEWTFTDRWRSEIVASWAELENRSLTPPVPPGVLDGQPSFTTDSRYRRGELLWINRLDIGDRSRLAFGLDFVDEQGSDDGTVDLGFAVLPNDYRLERTTGSGFIEWGREWTADVTSSLAVRWDQSDDESRASGKLGIAKTFPGHGGRLWAHVANGFKLPSFFALGNPLFGNPGLDPEKVSSVEVGYDREIGKRIEAGVSMFANEYEDLVDFDFENFINVNRGQVDINGVFVHARVRAATGLSIAADATLSDISTGAEPLRRRPEHTGGLRVTWQPSDAWSVDAATRYVGERLITSIPTGDVVDDAYVTVDATLRYRFSRSLAAWFALDNLFDTDWQDAPGFPAPGRSARLGAEVRFK